jgi:hypothetical protein
MKATIFIVTIFCAVIADYSSGAMQQVFGILTFIGVVLCFSLLHGWLFRGEKGDFK